MSMKEAHAIALEAALVNARLAAAAYVAHMTLARDIARRSNLDVEAAASADARALFVAVEWGAARSRDFPELSARLVSDLHDVLARSGDTVAGARLDEREADRRSEVAGVDEARHGQHADEPGAGPVA